MRREKIWTLLESGNHSSFAFVQNERSYMGMQDEGKFKTDLINEIQKRLPGSQVFHLDPTIDGDGIPDLLVVHNKRWGMLEAKKDENAKHRPHQDFYVDHFNKMSFASFISPSNKEEVLNDLENALRH